MSGIHLDISAKEPYVSTKEPDIHVYLKQPLMDALSKALSKISRALLRICRAFRQIYRALLRMKRVFSAPGP